MKNLLIRAACAVLLPAGLLFAQQTQPVAAPLAPDSHLATLAIYPFSPDLAPPRMQMAQVALAPRKGCKHSSARSAYVFFVMDADGNAHFTHNSGENGHSEWAVQLLQSEHYLPAKLNQKPVAVALNAEIQFDACRDKSAGKNPSFSQMRLWRQPKISFEPVGIPVTAARLRPDGSIESISTDQVQDVAFVVPGKVTPPSLVSAPEAVFPPEADRRGTCLFAVIVDPNGLPVEIGLVTATDPVFIPNALKAIRKYRFQPAIRNGKPVAVRITVEVSFRFG